MDIELDRADRALVAALADGLPLDPHPYVRLGEATGLSEGQVLSRLRRLAGRGVLSRFGVVVRHRALGYRANAMVVWDVPDHAVADVGRRLAEFPFVTLCYRRPRHLPVWPYNLFCMIHGRDRDEVARQIEVMKGKAGITRLPSATLFSERCFKQRGAAYPASSETLARSA